MMEFQAWFDVLLIGKASFREPFRGGLQDVRFVPYGDAGAVGREKTEGSLEPGKVADLIILSQDLFHTDPHKIGKTEVLVTVVGGKIVYESSDWAKKPQAKGGEQQPLKR